MYDQKFFINGKVSNNAFHFEERSNKQIVVAALIEGTLEEVKIGKDIVFEDFNDDGVLQSCRGLENFIRTKVKTEQEEVTMYIFDNHNHAFAFWSLEYAKKSFQGGATLIHIDQHKDTRKPSSYLSATETNNLETVFQYTNTVLNVGNFIDPAQKAGLIHGLIIIDSQASMNTLSCQLAREAKFSSRGSSQPQKDILLDIDLDFFSEEMNYISNSEKVALLQKLVPKAKMITVATSPFFIPQEKAIYWLHQIFQKFP